MKANEIPEKIQIHFIKNDYDAWSIQGYSFLDKQMGMVEYTRTDALIEKAIGWIDDNNRDGGCNFEGWEKDFKKYMEGE